MRHAMNRRWAAAIGFGFWFSAAVFWHWLVVDGPAGWLLGRAFAFVAGGSQTVTLVSFFFLPPLILAGLIYGWLRSGWRPRGSELRCIECGHVLKGLTEPQCPECGERI